MTGAQQRRSITALLIATLTAFLGIAASNEPLINESAPLGVVSLQLAYELPAAMRILLSWDEQDTLNAAFNLGLDYLYLVCYSLLLSVSCSYLARTKHYAWRGARRIGISLAWLLLVAAMLDMVENYALLKLLLGSNSVGLPKLATLCAIPKFGIVFASLLYMAITVLAAYRISRVRAAEPAKKPERPGQARRK